MEEQAGMSPKHHKETTHMGLNFNPGMLATLGMTHVLAAVGALVGGWSWLQSLSIENCS